jgi:hypothetical protein
LYSSHIFFSGGGTGIIFENFSCELLTYDGTSLRCCVIFLFTSNSLIAKVYLLFVSFFLVSDRDYFLFVILSSSLLIFICLIPIWPSGIDRLVATTFPGYLIS